MSTTTTPNVNIPQEVRNLVFSHGDLCGDVAIAMLKQKDNVGELIATKNRVRDELYASIDLYARRQAKLTGGLTTEYTEEIVRAANQIEEMRPDAKIAQKVSRILCCANNIKTHFNALRKWGAS